MQSPLNSDYFPTTNFSTKDKRRSKKAKKEDSGTTYTIPPPEKIQSWCRYLTSRQSSSQQRPATSWKLSRSPYLSPQTDYHRSPTVQSLDSVKRSKDKKRGISLTKNMFVSDTSCRSLQPIQTTLSQEASSKTMIEPKAVTQVSYRLQDFQKIGLLGNGGFGKVYLVRHLPTDILFAMKVISLATIQDQRLAKYLFEEKRVQQSCNHPFLVRLIEVVDQCHMLFQYFPGGDLLSHIRAYGKFKQEVVRIMLCEIVLALEYLHSKDIIYRDLKPENIVLDAEGHLYLTDFGLCKQVRGKTYTFCGSVGYIAPEVMRNEGHSRSVDWYHLGVLAYELLVGQPPPQPNPTVQTMTISLPAGISPALKSLIKGLLHLDPLQRLGSRLDSQQIRSHIFFRQVNWNAVLNRSHKLPAPTHPYRLVPQ